MSQITEDHIRQELDGWFFKYQPKLDLFEKRKVSPNFTPSHSSSHERGIAAGKASWANRTGRRTGRNKKRVPTAEQAELIRSYAAQGLGVRKIWMAMRAAGHKVSRSGIWSVIGDEP